MPKLKIKTHIIKATITGEQRNMVDKLLLTGKYISEADVIRQAILIYYAKISPPYLQLSPAGQMKQKKMENEQIIAAIPDEEFVAQNLEDVMIYTDTENQKWVLIRWIGNAVGAVLLSEIKTWLADKDDPIVKTHFSLANTGKTPYDQELTYNDTRKFLNERFGVAINFDPKANGGIYDEATGEVRPN